MQGRRPKPTALKRLQGNLGKQSLPDNEPKPLAVIDLPPDSLDKIAKAEWNRICPLLVNLGLYTNIDTTMLALYCSSFSRWVKAQAKIKKDGEILETKNGHPIRNPWLDISNKCWAEIKVSLVEFGMTPSSRTRFQIKPINKKKKRSFLT
jgi:P27 family predicted phage terminase small subunit